MNAALGGASRVVTVDLDAEAIGLSRRNFALNGIDATPHDFWAADVGETIKRLQARGERFDIVILDPPAYAKSQRAVEAALSGYAALNRTALALVRTGGLLCTASCTARVSSEAFLEAIREAAAKADVRLQLLFQRFQPPDHPIALQFPQARPRIQTPSPAPSTACPRRFSCWRKASRASSACTPTRRPS